jgi:outer membrane protein assembly factor BamA
MAGDMHDPAATRRSASELEGRLVRLGHLDAAVRTHTRVAGEQRVDLCLAVDAGPVYHVRKLAFEGNQVLSDKEMRAALDEGLEKSDRGKLNAEGGLFRADLLEGERLFLDSAAYERGLLQWKAEPPEVKRTKLPNGEGAVDIVVRVHEGPVFHLAEVGFSGALGAPAATYQAFIDVHAGEVFARAKILAIIARADELHKQLGRVDLKVHPDVALVGDLAEVDLKVESAAQ